MYIVFDGLVVAIADEIAILVKSYNCKLVYDIFGHNYSSVSVGSAKTSSWQVWHKPEMVNSFSERASLKDNAGRLHETHMFDSMQAVRSKPMKDLKNASS